MKLNRHIDFINEMASPRPSKKSYIDDEGRRIFNGDLIIKKNQIKDGKLNIYPYDIVTGDFICSNNQLTSLEGGPNEVGRNFACDNNQLTSLEGGPYKVGKSFWCNANKLTSLEGVPKEVNEIFNCSFNKLTSLEGGPTLVGESFVCSDNKLTSLEGGPTSVGGSFNCFVNQLTSLEGGPTSVGGYFICTTNQFDLSIEKRFIKSGNYLNNYWIELFKYMLSNKIELIDVKGWPKSFIKTLKPKYKNLLSSSTVINKFNL